MPNESLDAVLAHLAKLDGKLDAAIAEQQRLSGAVKTLGDGMLALTKRVDSQEDRIGKAGETARRAMQSFSDLSQDRVDFQEAVRAHVDRQTNLIRGAIEGLSVKIENVDAGTENLSARVRESINVTKQQAPMIRHTKWWAGIVAAALTVIGQLLVAWLQQGQH